MAVRIDKEVLIKHHFWIMLGVSVLLLLVALVALASTVGQRVDKEEKAFSTTKGMLKNLKDFKNDKFVKAYTIQDEVVKQKKDEVWAQSWELQKDMMTWPDQTEIDWPGKYPYFGYPIDLYDRDKYPHQYASQLYDVVEVVQPLRENGKGIVQLAGGYSGLLHLDVEFKQIPPSREDIWTAQEDLWVKRELLRVVREANDEVARFKEVNIPNGSATKEAERGLFHKRYRNTFWELDITLAQKNDSSYVLRGTIKNISRRRLARNSDFHVLLEPVSSELIENVVIPVTDEPLAPGASAAFKDVSIRATASVQGLFGVEQILTWRTAPVKRIERLDLDYPSSRTGDRQLRPLDWDNRPPGSKVVDSVAPVSPPPSGQPDPLGGQPVTPTDPNAGAKSKNGLDLYRYTDVGESVRHMPVAMAVLIEEDQIPDFLAAFSNSRLRIQTLQVQWRHTREKLAGPADEGTSADPNAKGAEPRATRPDLSSLPAAPNMGMPMAPKAGMPGRGAGQRDKRLGAARGDANQLKTPANSSMMSQIPSGLNPSPSALNMEEEADMNLVQLAVYGIASLYERYPPPEQGAPPK
ncbi:MAG TPA: hypothetical protein VK395_32355 [Gemmataceae bacterium]|nr:hypothetical protein [Gemmataceae bacterium]